KDEPFSGSTTNHSDALPPSSSPVKTSDNLEEFADELTLLKKGVHEENFQVYSSPLFEIDDNFTSSNVNPLFNKMVEDDENENSNVSNSDEPVFLNIPLSDKVECSDPEVDIDETDVFLAMEVSSNFEEDYYDSEGDVIFLESLLSDDSTHNLAPESWQIRSWRLYTLSNVHVLETISGEVLYMFVDVSYPLSVKLMERMLKHKLEIDKDVVGNDMTTAEQLIRFIKNQLAAAQVSPA
ncbi:hypothetical protein Tco_0835947, partial [Tanacetum coccineum]